ncbi:MAG: glycosyltransferase family 1 protein [Microbacteriaceae bacterium]
MRIVFDCRYTRIDHHDGISRYTAGLVAALARLHPLTMLISDHRQLAMLPELPWELIAAPTSVAEPLVARSVNRLKPDVVFSPMQTMGSWRRDYALVLTVHDLIYYTNRTPPRDLAWPIRLLWRLYHLAWWPQRVLLNRADAVVTVSETTKRLIAAHRLTTRPVSVVPNAAGSAASDSVQDPAPRRRSLVYMGSFMPYKNVETLVTAMRSLGDYELHLMSKISPAQRARLTALAPDAALIFHDGASDTEYHDCLRRATALVTASLDEGFGIPLLEAMSLGTPVVVSDIPIFREIAGEAASYFSPRDAPALAEAVRALQVPEVWQPKSAQSRLIASRYSWDTSAKRLLTVLTTTAAQNSRGLS